MYIKYIPWRKDILIYKFLCLGGLGIYFIKYSYNNIIARKMNNKYLCPLTIFKEEK